MSNVFKGTEKDYAVSLGLASPGRGRMSREAKEAVDKAKAGGMTFSGSAPQSTRPPAGPTQPPPPRPPVTPRPPRSEVDPKAVREWARANGFTVGDRGRIHGDIVAAYAAANPDAKPEVKVSANVVVNESPRIYPSGTRFRVTDNFTSGKSVFVSSKAACADSGYSLSHCGSCQTTHRVMAKGFKDLITVRPEG